MTRRGGGRAGRGRAQTKNEIDLIFIIHFSRRCEPERVTFDLTFCTFGLSCVQCGSRTRSVDVSRRASLSPRASPARRPSARPRTPRARVRLLRAGPGRAGRRAPPRAASHRVPREPRRADDGPAAEHETVTPCEHMLVRPVRSLLSEHADALLSCSHTVTYATPPATGRVTGTLTVSLQ